MRRSKTFLTIVMGATMVVALALMFATTSSAFASGWGRHSQKTLFVQTNNTTANQIMVYDRAWDGTLTFAASYATGGMGGTASGATADPLASQDSLVTTDHGRVLLAVNAGSNTVSLFRVRGDRLWLKQVIASNGQFPVSIAVHRDLVYVLNAGLDGSVQGFWLGRDHLWPIWGSNRTLGLGNTNPPDYLHSPGQVGFTPDGHKLIVTTKASTSAIDVFRVRDSGRLSNTAVSTTSQTPVPFAFVFDPMGRLVVTEALNSYLSTYTITPDNSLASIGSTADTQAAACWVSAARGFYYVSNAGSGTVSSFTLDGSGVPVLANATAATIAPGVTDSVATRDQRFLYVECGGAGTISAFRVNHDGSLTLVQTVTGLPMPPEAVEGIALD
jgi:6-phosphogluconolactonase (cycloisomerase 2 family)